VNDSTAPSTIDPAELVNLSDTLLTTELYTTLVQYGTSPATGGTTVADYAKIEPFLAKSWTISPNGLVYTFHLNHDYKFDDGTPIEAKDVIFSFKRSITMDGDGAYVVLDGHYTPSEYKSMKAEGPWTLVLTLNAADPGALDVWAQPDCSVVEPSVINAHGGVVANKVSTYVQGHVAGGGGIYRLESYQPGVQATLVANPRSPIQPKSHKVQVNFISSPATLGLDAKDKEADITLGLADATAHSLKSVSGVRVLAYPTASSEQFGFNTLLSPTKNLDLRKALEYAVPYKSILKSVAFRYGSLFKGEWLPPMAAFNKSVQGSAYPEDLSKARALLSSSGLKLPIQFSVIVESGDTAGAQVATVLQSEWATIGVKITIDTLSPTEYVDALEAHTDTAFIRDSGPGVPAAAYYVGYDLVCGLGPNATQTCIPQLDTDLTDAEAHPVDQQQPYWNAIDQLMLNYAPKIQLYAIDAPVVLSSKVKSFEFTTEDGGMRYWG
jgi:peptide/nickel transport system substrate-binding protein